MEIRRFVWVLAAVPALLSAGTRSEMDGGAVADPHAHHRQMMQREAYSRSEHRYEVPAVVLTSMDGHKVALAEELQNGQPVLLNFIFTTCTTICPVLSASFTQVQKELGPEASHVQMISVSIDPQNDSPAKLSDYAKRFKAGPGWQFLTGDLDDVIAVQKAFDAYRGDKMNHPPLTFMRASAEGSWVRFEGFASAADLVREYRDLTTR